ncbi:MAG: hypothetical protein WCI88_04235 [Chloroflexota bacterium]
MSKNKVDLIETISSNHIAYSQKNINRFYVLVPSIIKNDIQLARKIRSMATEDRQEVIFLSIVKDINTKYSAERRLTTLAAITRDKRVQTRYQALFASDWVEVLQQIVQPGDAVICHEEQLTKHNHPLNKQLITKLSTPVISLSGYFVEESTNDSFWQPQLFFWGAIFAVIIFFLIFEINVDALIDGWVGRAVLIIVLMVEFSLIWILNTIRLER